MAELVAEGLSVIMVSSELPEILGMSDRVVVMGGGPSHGVPGHVTKVVEVKIPHPRDVTAPEFNALKRELLDAIHHVES